MTRDSVAHCGKHVRMAAGCTNYFPTGRKIQISVAANGHRMDGILCSRPDEMAPQESGLRRRNPRSGAEFEARLSSWQLGRQTCTWELRARTERSYTLPRRNPERNWCATTRGQRNSCHILAESRRAT